MTAGKAHPPAPRAVLHPDDLVPDAAVATSDEDRFEHDAIAGRIAELAVGATPPVNVALYGPWGAGKSSVYALMKQRVKDLVPDAKVVRYDAWKYGGQSLKRNFITSVAQSLGVQDTTYTEGLSQSQERYSIDLLGWIRANMSSIVTALGVALGVAGLWLLVTAWVLMLTSATLPWVTALNGQVGSAGTVFSLILAGALVGPKALESATAKIVKTAPANDDEFAQHFSDLVDEALGKRRTKRLIVFIDELDRCAPEDVVATLVDLKTFLDQDGCVFVVAADREVLEASLQKVPQANPVREAEPYYSTPGAFLDKIFQHQFALPPLRPFTLTGFARNLVIGRGGVWEQLRLRDEQGRLLDRVVYSLVPAHIRSPRRVKILLNAYATGCRVAEARGVDWLERATEMAKLVVLQTEFPAFATDLLRQPLLGAQVLGDVEVEPGSQRLVNKWRVDDDSAEQPANPGAAEHAESPAGPLLGGDGASAGALRRVDWVLRQQLVAYLRKTAADDVPDPRPDLLFIQGAGANEGLGDPDLGAVIDLASDTDPDSVLAAFVGRTDEEIAIGARLLAQAADSHFGPGRTNVVESACRLIEGMPVDAVAPVATILAPTALIVLHGHNPRPSMLPGALMVGLAAGNEPLLYALDNRLDDLSGEQISDIYTRATTAVPLMDADRAQALAMRIGEVYEQRPSPLHHALATLPQDSATMVWEENAERVERVLTALATPPEPPEPPASAAAGRTRNAVVAAEPEQPEINHDPHASQSRFRDLIEAVDSRSKPHETLLSAVLLMGQQHRDAGVREAAEEYAHNLVPNFTDAGRRNEHALVALADPGTENYQAWVEILDGRGPAQPARVTSALKGAMRSLATGDQQATTIPGIVASIAALLPREPDGGLAVLFDQHEDYVLHLLTKIGWDSDAAGPKRAAVYQIVEDTPHLFGPAADHRIATDLWLVHDEDMTDDDVLKRATDAVALMPPGAARLADEMTVEPSAKDGATHINVLRLEIAVRARWAGPAIPAEDIAHALGQASTASANEVTGAWLALRPTVADVLTLVPDSGVPAEARLRRYAASLSAADRTDLWIGLETQAVTTRLLKAAAAGQSLTGKAVTHIRGRIDDQSQFQARSDLIGRLRTVDLDHDGLATPTGELALYLLAKNLGGDATLAADLIQAAGGPPRGQKEKLRVAFQAAEDRSSKTFNAGQKNFLIGQALIRKPPKKGLLNQIGRILG